MTDKCKKKKNKLTDSSIYPSDCNFTFVSSAFSNKEAHAFMTLDLLVGT